jgi:hypothetical protein
MVKSKRTKGPTKYLKNKVERHRYMWTVPVSGQKRIMYIFVIYCFILIRKYPYSWFLVGFVLLNLLFSVSCSLDIFGVLLSCCLWPLYCLFYFWLHIWYLHAFLPFVLHLNCKLLTILHATNIDLMF